MNRVSFDVAIIGGGLAGSLLARQLRIAMPSLTIGVFEKRAETSYKVGESTVEIATNYFLRRLNLSAYLHEHQLPKNGLRFFFDDEEKSTDLWNMSEIGGVAFPYHPAFQIDRARMEADLLNMNQENGINVYREARVENIHLGTPSKSQTRHSFDVQQAHNQNFHGQARWIIDASGRSSLLARQLHLRLPESGHTLGSIWGRFRHVTNIDTVGPDTFRKRIRYTSRRLATCHFCYSGYWIWVIPLGEGVTSVGVVLDRSVHWEDTLRKEEGFLAFLRKHAAVWSLLKNAELIDIGSLGSLSYGTQQYLSSHGWGLTGEAAAFTDPFYSPGSDFIALENDFLTDLIQRDLQEESEERLQQIASLYNDYMCFRYEASMRLYRNLYSLLGSYPLLKLKWQLDFPLYYHLWLSQYMQDLHLQEDFLRTQLSEQDLILNALSNFSLLFTRLDTHMRANGTYFHSNQHQFTNALEGVNWVEQVGTPQGLHQELKRLNQIFNSSRQSALNLLPSRSDIEQIQPSLSLSQFLTPHPLVESIA